MLRVEIHLRTLPPPAAVLDRELVQTELVLQPGELVVGGVDHVDPHALLAGPCLLDDPGLERPLVLQRAVVVDAAGDHGGASLSQGRGPTGQPAHRPHGHDPLGREAAAKMTRMTDLDPLLRVLARTGRPVRARRDRLVGRRRLRRPVPRAPGAELRAGRDPATGRALGDRGRAPARDARKRLHPRPRRDLLPGGPDRPRRRGEHTRGPDRVGPRDGRVRSRRGASARRGGLGARRDLLARPSRLGATVRRVGGGDARPAAGAGARRARPRWSTLVLGGRGRARRSAGGTLGAGTDRVRGSRRDVPGGSSPRPRRGAHAPAGRGGLRDGRASAPTCSPNPRAMRCASTSASGSSASRYLASWLSPLEP